MAELVVLRQKDIEQLKVAEAAREQREAAREQRESATLLIEQLEGKSLPRNLELVLALMAVGSLAPIVAAVIVTTATAILWGVDAQAARTRKALIKAYLDGNHSTVVRYHKGERNDSLKRVNLLLSAFKFDVWIVPVAIIALVWLLWWLSEFEGQWRGALAWIGAKWAELPWLPEN